MTATPAQTPQVAVERLEAFVAEQRRQRTVRERDGLPTEVAEHGGGLSAYEYTEAGDLARITEPDGSSVSFAYDERRRLARVADERFGTTLYRYGENDRLAEVEGGGVRHRFEHDAAGRLVRARRGAAGAVEYEYDAAGRVTRARTAECSTEHEYDDEGRVTEVRQTLGGVALVLRLSYDGAGRLASVLLPGGAPVLYEWDERGRPSAVGLGPRPFARFDYDDEAREARVRFANGVTERSVHDPVGGRPLRREVARGGEVLARRESEYGAEGRLRRDGQRVYDYDALGRLARAGCAATGRNWEYVYDARDNLLAANGKLFVTEVEGRGPAGAPGEAPPRGPGGASARGLGSAGEAGAGGVCELSYDRGGRLVGKCSAGAEHAYRYDDAGQLTEVLRDGAVVARFAYDHKGRLAAMRRGGATERYLYGPGDELFAVTDEGGRPLRLFVRTPLGCVGEVRGGSESGEALFLHQDERGACFLVTDEWGVVVARPRLDPFGAPLSAEPTEEPVTFCGRRWFPSAGLYYFGARWYDPEACRFLTPDTFTARPDDARIVNALGDASAQATARASLLPGWAARPRLRNRYAYCGNDPVNCVDPNGHWSVGYVILSVFGAIWTLPNTLFGLLVEITCLVGEVVRWLVWVFTAGHVSWATPGFDVAASGRLNAYALVFEGGWLGSFERLLGITFGNVFFVYKDWRTHPALLNLPDEVAPPAYGGAVKIKREEVLYEHELRHTNQYQWLGPFFHLGLPLWGVYEWEVILHGYTGAWMEVDARRHAEPEETAEGGDAAEGGGEGEAEGDTGEASDTEGEGAGDTGEAVDSGGEGAGDSGEAVDAEGEGAGDSGEAVDTGGDAGSEGGSEAGSEGGGDGGD